MKHAASRPHIVDDFQDDLGLQDEEELQAGTGFMIQLADIVRDLEKKGYDLSLRPCGDHFQSLQVPPIYPDDFNLDHIRRFENTSDPDDSAILYALSIPKLNRKGLFIEPYGIYHEDMSQSLRDGLSFKGR